MWGWADAVLWRGWGTQQRAIFSPQPETLHSADLDAVASEIHDSGPATATKTAAEVAEKVESSCGLVRAGVALRAACADVGVSHLGLTGGDHRIEGLTARCARCAHFWALPLSRVHTALLWLPLVLLLSTSPPL